MNFTKDFKRGFAKGLVILLPTAVTLFILVKVFRFVLDSIGNPIARALEWSLTRIGLAEPLIWLGMSRTVDGKAVLQIHGGIGFLIAIVVVYLLGSFFASFIGRKLLPMAERLMSRIPVFRVVYPYAKQVTDFFLEEKKQADYQLVVAVPYPRKGIYSLGFLTGDGMRAVRHPEGSQTVSVFIPSSPMPVTGYTVLVDPAELIELDITVDQALRFTISGGVIVPPSQVQQKATLDKPTPVAKESDK